MNNEFNGRHISRISDLSEHGADEIDRAEVDVNERFQYDPYGMQDQPACQEGDGKSASDPYIGFQGGMIDPLAKTIHFEPRDFNPAVGRWMDQEPEAYVEGAIRFPAPD